MKIFSMKPTGQITLILALCFLFPQLSYSQHKTKAYGFLGMTTFLSPEFDNRAGVGAGFGLSPNSHFSAGAGFDLFIFNKRYDFVQGYADFRVFFLGLNKKASPFIALQPGAVIYNKTTRTGSVDKTTRGSFAANALFGLMTRPGRNGPGIYFAGGFSSISFVTSGEQAAYSGFKILMGVAF